jgi:hypothetical protein
MLCVLGGFNNLFKQPPWNLAVQPIRQLGKKESGWIPRPGHDKRDFRLEWVERIGLGFDLPAPIGQLGQLHIVPKVA